MKSTWFSSSIRYEFAKCIEAADTVRQPWDNMQSFLMCACIALRQPTIKLRTGDISQELENQYLQEIGRVHNPDQFPKALALLTDALEVKSEDFLGQVMGELGLLDTSWKGQCFTPDSLCSLMADVLLSGIGAPVSGKTLTLSEPACGGGAMIIAASETLKRLGYYPWHYWWQATDVDYKCFCMTYIQTTLLGIPVSVVWGNTLTGETFDQADTYAAVVHPPKFPKPKPLKVDLPKDSSVLDYFSKMGVVAK